jgi:CRISPR-associated protein Cas2
MNQVRPESTRYVICYDITDQKRRARLSKCLDGYGDRVQFSVFEAVLDKPLFDHLQQDAGEIIDPVVDRIFIFPLCAGCAKRALRLGKPTEVPGEETVFVV